MNLIIAAGPIPRLLEKMDPLRALPLEVGAHLLSFLSGDELAKIATVCKGWHAMTEDELLWKDLCRRVFRITLRQIQPPLTWKALFVERRRLWKSLSQLRLSTENVNVDDVKFSNDLRTITYIGSDSQSNDTVGAVQSTKPLQIVPLGNNAVASYFEVHIDSIGQLGAIGIGIAFEGFPLSRGQPGWKKGSYGYHGDDGRLYRGAGWGPTWGPTYTAGDVIGCGINYRRRELFYTKNGKFLGVAVPNLAHAAAYHAAFGLHSFGEQMTVNFGHDLHSFVFDLVHYVDHADTADAGPSVHAAAGLSTSTSELGVVLGLESTEDDTPPPKIDWSATDEEHNPFEYMVDMLQSPGVENDRDFLSHLRGLLVSMGLVADASAAAALDVAELQRIVRACYSMYERRRIARHEWDDVQPEERPRLSEEAYSQAKRDVRVLNDKEVPHTSPLVDEAVQRWTHLLGNAAYDVSSERGLDRRRRKLIYLLLVECHKYESAMFRRDLAVVQRTGLPNDHPRILLIVERHLSPLMAEDFGAVMRRFGITRQELARVADPGARARYIVGRVLECLLETSQAAVERLMQQDRVEEAMLEAGETPFREGTWREVVVRVRARAGASVAARLQLPPQDEIHATEEQ